MLSNEFLVKVKSILAWAVLLVLGTAGAAAAQEHTPGAGFAHPWQMGLQDAASPGRSLMIGFHDLLLVVITLIVLLVLGLLVYVMVRFNAKRNPVPSRTSHNTVIEVVWTIVPVLILVGLAIPSMRLLYFLDRTADPEMTLVVHGYQWYWGYEYPDQQIAEFSSNLVPDDQIQPGQLRLLSTDNPVVLPVDTNIQILVRAADVLHSWALPAFGIKIDAVPGHMNETWVRIEREGIYYGQCSELCGTNHGFMPIEIHAVSRAAFNEWVRQHAGPNPATPPRLLSVASESTAPGSTQTAAAAAQ